MNPQQQLLLLRTLAQSTAHRSASRLTSHWRRTMATASATATTSGSTSTPSAADAAALEKQATFDKDMVARYLSTPLAYTNLPVDNVRFEIGTKANGEKHPVMKYADLATPNLVHVTPVALAYFCRFGKTGNFGTVATYKTGKVEIKELADAKYEVAIYDKPTNDTLTSNELFAGYLKWLDAIQAKYRDHLTQNLDAYPTLKKKFGYLLNKNPDLVGEALQQEFTPLYRVRELKNEDGTSSGKKDIYFDIKQKIYVPKGKFTPKAQCAEDEEMIAKGFRRLYVPMYDAHGGLVPLESQRINFNDLICLEVELGPQLFVVAGNHFCGIRKTLKSVTMLRSPPKRRVAFKAAPLGAVVADSVQSPA